MFLGKCPFLYGLPVRFRLLVKFRACRDPAVHHEKIQALMAVLLVYGGNQHSAGINAHHLSRRQVHDGDAGFADQLLRLVILVNSA